MSNNTKKIPTRHEYTPKHHLESVIKKLYPTISRDRLVMMLYIFSSDENRFKSGFRFKNFSEIAGILYEETIDGEIV